MDIKVYNVIITPTAYNEICQIYDYLFEVLCAVKAAEELMLKFKEMIKILKYKPRIYTEILILDGLERCYRRCVFNNYIVLYTISEKENKVFISHVYYGKRNYM